MVKVIYTNPEMNKLFQEGNHVIRWRDRYWAGLSTALIIEQMLMKSLKTSGVLTRGGMTQAQRTIWLLLMPACAEISQTMEVFRSTSYLKSEQHKDSTKARFFIDNGEMKGLARFLEARNPFEGDQSLRCISSGVVADDNDSVTVDPQLLFQRLISATKGNINPQELSS